MFSYQARAKPGRTGWMTAGRAPLLPHSASPAELKLAGLEALLKKWKESGVKGALEKLLAPLGGCWQRAPSC